MRNRVAGRDVPRGDAGLRSPAWGRGVGSPRSGSGHEGFSAPQPGDTGWPPRAQQDPRQLGNVGGGEGRAPVRGAEGRDQGVGDGDCGPSTMTLG